jgi:uncharacterized protein
MMKMMPARHLLFPLLTCLLVLAGCGTTPVSRYYMLTPMDSGTSTQTLAGDPHIGVGPISFPKYLDRPQIITRTNSAEIYMAETERWAEPLQENFTRVLAENLSRQLGTVHISIEPSRSRGEIDMRVIADILQFDADESGDVILLAYWNVQDRNNSSLSGMHKTEIRLPVPDRNDRTSVVKQLSAAVAGLSREMATELSRVSTQVNPGSAP